MVFQLVKKDLTYLVTSLKTTLATIIIFSLCLPLIGIGFGIVIPALVCYIGFYSILAYEERNKTNLLNIALPVSRRDICMSKYIEVILMIIVTCILALLSIVLSGFTSVENSMFLQTYFKVIIPLMIGIALIYSAIMLPCVFYFGTIKSRYVLLGIYLVIFILGNSIANADVGKMIQWIQDYFGKNYNIIGMVLAVIGFIVSYFISLRVWEHKEF